MRVIVVGGGISGLTAAYELTRAGADCTLVEPAPRCGGILHTTTLAGCLIECGADSFLAAKPAALELIAELGLSADVVENNEAMRRTFVLKHGRLLPLPAGMQMVVPTQFWPLLSTRLLGWESKLRMAADLFRRPVTLPDRSVSAFVRGHFGAEAVELLAEPLLSGVYGGSPDDLGVEATLPRFAEVERKYGSLARGLRAEQRSSGQPGPLFKSLRGGLSQLTDALESAVSGKIRFVREPAGYVENGRIRVASEWLSADHVILACGAPRAARLLAGTEAGALLAGISHSSATVVALGYHRAEVTHPLNGFGFLVPRRERRAIMAATWVGTKFPSRMAPGLTVIRAFVPGTGHPGVVQDVKQDLVRIMDLRAAPVFERVDEWPDSLAQYGVGHRALVGGIRAGLAHLGAISVIGNAFEGVGIPDCIRLARATVRKLLES